MCAAQVKVEWSWLDWRKGYKWGENVLPQLYEVGLDEVKLSRAVYVVRANGEFAIQYPKGISPTLYIGEGNFKDRIVQHRNWLDPLIKLVGDFSFQIGVSIPRVKNSEFAYRDFEAALLIQFREIYGCAPLMNSQMEKRRNDYEYVPEDAVRSAIMIGKGIRYHWALSPMKSSPFFNKYWKTHVE